MKKLFYVFVISIILISAVAAWLLLGSATGFTEKEKYLYIRTGETQKSKVLNQLRQEKLIRHISVFTWLANQLNVWERLKPGRYAIQRGTSMLQIIRMLRNGRQTPLSLTITKLRTKENLASLIARKTEHDSIQIIQIIQDSEFLARYGVDSNTVLTIVLPDTYEIYWTSTPQTLFDKFKKQHDYFWNESRRAKAGQLGLTPQQVYILASIVEEETNRQEEKPLIASVYLNRLKKNMYLAADPTIKFALRNFGLKRIRFGHINSSAANPYNTYRHKGLPPGPICTPSIHTLNAVLDAPDTDYLFFCAQPGGTGLHNFAATEQEHMRNARAYQQWLDSLQLQ